MRRRTSRARSRSYSRSGGVTTRQRDQAVRYSGGRRRRGRGRGVRRFRYRVMNTLLSQEPLQVWTNAQSFSLSSAVNRTGIFGCGLFTTNLSGQTDLASLFTDAGLDTSVSTNDGSRLYIKSACMDVELKNTSSLEVILDVYVVIPQKTVPNQNDIATQFDNTFQKMTGSTGTGGATPSNAAPVSLFENPVFCQYYKIISKREMIILPGEITTMQMRFGKDRMIEAQQVINNPNSIPRLAKFYIFSFHGPPDPTAGPSSTPALAGSSMVLSFQKVYKYAVAPTPKQLPHITEV